MAKVGTRRDEWLLCAPEAGILKRTLKSARDRVEVGESLGYVELSPEVWEAKFSGN